MNMLTKSDLSQVGEVVRSIIKEEVPPMIEKHTTIALKPIRQDIQNLREDINVIVEGLYSSLEKRVHRIEQKLEL